MTDTVVDAETLDEAAEDAAWTALAAYCCKALTNSDSSLAPPVATVAALLDVLSLVAFAELAALAEFAELAADVELDDAVASAGGASSMRRCSWWWPCPDVTPDTRPCRSATTAAAADETAELPDVELPDVELVELSLDVDALEAELAVEALLVELEEPVFCSASRSVCRSPLSLDAELAGGGGGGGGAAPTGGDPLPDGAGGLPREAALAELAEDAEDAEVALELDAASSCCRSCQPVRLLDEPTEPIDMGDLPGPSQRAGKQ